MAATTASPPTRRCRPTARATRCWQPETALALELAVERHLAGGGVLSAGLFHRRIDGLIRRRIALESVPEATVPRWVSRPVNLGRAWSSGLELEAKGRADQWLPGVFVARSPLTCARA
jgi:outer membrane receptor for ferrienterochelin and colicins